MSGSFTNKFVAVLVLVISMVASVSALAHPFDQTYESAVEALDAYRALIDDYPEDIELHYLLGTMLITANELDEARERFEFVLENDPKYDMAWYKLAEVYYRKQDFETAREQLQHIKDEELQDERFTAESTILLKLEKPEEALIAAESAIEADEENPGGWLYKGLASEQLGDTQTALDMILKSLKMDSTQPMVYEWFREKIDKYLSSAKQEKMLLDLLEAVPSDTTQASRIEADILTLRTGEPLIPR